MKKVLFFTVLILLLTSTAYAQKVFSVQYENQADVKVFVVNYENQAGWKNNSKKHFFF